KRREEPRTKNAVRYQPSIPLREWRERGKSRSKRPKKEKQRQKQIPRRRLLQLFARLPRAKRNRARDDRVRGGMEEKRRRAGALQKSPAGSQRYQIKPKEKERARHAVPLHRSHKTGQFRACEFGLNGSSKRTSEGSQRRNVRRRAPLWPKC